MELVPLSHGCAPEGSAASALLLALLGSSVTVCTVWLAFCHVTVLPLATVRVAGSKRIASVMLTTEVLARAPAAGEAAAARVVGAPTPGLAGAASG
jgi:hypothetical protein